MATGILVNIVSGNGLLPDGTKPRPEPMLTPVMFIWGQFRLRYDSHQSLKLAWKLLFYAFIEISQVTIDLNIMNYFLGQFWFIESEFFKGLRSAMAVPWGGS